jgi:uncharacterized protein YndB with AHSA1/START domain
VDADSVNESVFVAREPEEVYRYFVEPDALVSWMGEEAVLDPRPNGKFFVEIEGTSVRGRYLELDPPRRLLISWGFVDSATLPPESSRVEVSLVRQGAGTMVYLRHWDLSEDDTTRHAAGWKRFLALLSEHLGAPRIAHG